MQVVALAWNVNVSRSQGYNTDPTIFRQLRVVVVLLALVERPVP
jgi:hypothetical protein